MRLKEFATETYVNSINNHMGFGTERPQNRQLIELPRNRLKRKERKLKDHIGMTIGTNSAGGNWANSGAKFKQM